MSLITRLLRRVLPVCGLSLLACTAIGPNESSSIGGTGSEVVGVVNYPDSSGVPKLRANTVATGVPVISGNVFINPFDYLADTGHAGETPVTETKPDGSFRISNVLPGTHIVYIRDNSGNAVARKITVSENEGRVDVGTLYAKKTAGVSLAYSGATPGEVLFFIDLRGTGLQLRCAERDLQFMLNRIPCGADYSVVVRMFKPLRKDYEFTAVNPVPGITTTLQAITGE